MKEEYIPDLNLFMMCERVDRQAMRALPGGYRIRNCRPDELLLWKTFPFDTPILEPQHAKFMDEYFSATYSHAPDLFFENTLFVCDTLDTPVATCSSWKAYGKFHSIHWFKTLKAHEGRGIGRALLSVIMQRFARDDFPIFLHTQPGSFRAIKLYADFGFHLLGGEKIGTRTNDLAAALPILEVWMPAGDYARLTIAEPPAWFLDAVRHEQTMQF